MTTKTRNILIGVAIFAAGAGLLYYRRKQASAEADALISYVNGSVTQNDTDKAVGELMKKVDDVKFIKNKVNVDGKTGWNVNAIVDVTRKLHDAMSGLGTNVPVFMANFKRIKNMNTMYFINQLYTRLYGEGLFDAMKGETKLSGGGTPAKFINIGKWIATPVLAAFIPSINEGWNEDIKNHLESLKPY